MATPDAQPHSSDPDDPQPVITTVPGVASEQRRVLFGHVRLGNVVSALRHRNYRLFFSGQIISLTGTWMQITAEGWLVYQLTHSELALGIIRFLHTLPVTLFALYAGVVADRFPKRKIMLITQTVAMALAFILFGLVAADVVRTWQIGLLVFFVGTTNAFDHPARQSFVIEMVGKKDLMNAVVLNSSVFNGARVAGPALAGLVIAMRGVAACFFLNAISFVAVIFAYLSIRTAPKTPVEQSSSVRKETLEAFRYVLHQPTLRFMMLMISSVSLLVLPYSVLMPIFAAEILGVGASGYGLLLSANGIGAFLGALSLASLGDYPRKERLVFLGILGMLCSLFVFALSETIWISVLMLAFAGWFMIIFFSTANTLVQSVVPDQLRGRVMGIYSFCFLGITPFGSLIAGAVSKATHVSTTLAGATAICFAIALIVLLKVRKISRLVE